MEAAAVVELPIPAQLVGNAFVQQYYHILHHSPGLVFKFYQDISKLGRPEDDGSMSITTTMEAINDKILSLNYEDLRTELKSVDSQESLSGGVHVLVTGCSIGKDNLVRNFSQTFFLAPQEKGYFVLTDIFRYLESSDRPNIFGWIPGPATDSVALAAPEQDPPQVQQSHVSEQSAPSEEETNNGEVYNPSANGDGTHTPVIEEEAPVAEVVDEPQEDSQVVVESNIRSEDAPKKSYASIVIQFATSSPPPAPVPQKPTEKSVEQVNQPVIATDDPISSSDSVSNVNNQNGVANVGYSIYVRGLPFNATEALLAEEFQRFGLIKNRGVQVKNNGQVFGFGFVEFEEASAVQKAIEASPILIGGRQVFIEEKKSTNSRGVYRGRNGRPPVYRNDGTIRGRGNYNGGRGYYNRGDFGGRSHFNNRVGPRGGSYNRGPSFGYQRVDNLGGSNVDRMNRGGRDNA